MSNSLKGTSIKPLREYRVRGSLKDLYSPSYISLLASCLQEVQKNFPTQEFTEAIFNKEWKRKELKQRMRHISCTLGLFLNGTYPQNISVLEEVFFKMNSAYALENMIFQDYVEVYGLDDFTISMKALASFTQGSSSEFAIRQFILRYEKKTMEQMRMWALSSNEHIRRLASEGCRPRLPWAIALQGYKADPSEVLSVLELLKDDEALYVRKSVANALNDISKDHPELVRTLAKNWFRANKNRHWLVKHGCRTLLKQGDKEVLSLFGFKPVNKLELNAFNCSKQVNKGETFFFEFTLNSLEGHLGKLRIEYALEFVRLREKSSKKVFKISEGDFLEKKKVLKKSYSFKAISTRKYYLGEHKLFIIVNGEVLHEVGFELI